MSQAIHICPKCSLPLAESSFVGDDGKSRKWCRSCRAAYRIRLTNLHAKREVIEKAFVESAPEVVARTEGYKDHPLAHLLALSHIAGAKRAIAIRDGRSWRGKKAWREYYKVKGELDALLAPPKHPLLEMKLPEGYHWRVYGGDPERPTYSPKLTELVNSQLALKRIQANAVLNGTSEMSDEEIDAEIKRDPKSEDVS